MVVASIERASRSSGAMGVSRRNEQLFARAAVMVAAALVVAFFVQVLLGAGNGR